MINDSFFETELHGITLHTAVMNPLNPELGGAGASALIDSSDTGLLTGDVA